MALIIYGTADYLGKSFETDEYCCPYCDHYNTTELYIGSTYFHFFFIPYLPTGKYGSSLCSHCKKVVQQINFNQALVSIFRDHYQLYRHPLKLYAGFLILPGSFIIALIISSFFSLFS